MKKIGILGGSFNPIHKAHVRMAKRAAKQYNLDEVWFMPTHHPPHKDEKEFISDEHRERMIRTTIEKLNKKSSNNHRYIYSDIEMKRDGITYTYETLKYLRERYPDTKWYFIIGADSLYDFPTWKNPEVILDIADILVADRASKSYQDISDDKYETHEVNDDISSRINSVKTKLGGSISTIDMSSDKPLASEKRYANISSASIRQKLKSNDKTVTSDLSDRVYRYIKLHGLYGVRPLIYEVTPDEKELKKCLKATLRLKRYIHTKSVADTAVNLAHIYGADANKIMYAALLHDCAKYYTVNEQISLCDEYGIELTDTQRDDPALIHADLGAYLAKNRYGIDDEDVLSAIRCHTVGKPDMSLIEKIIFVSDYIEPGRSMECSPYPLEDIRNICQNDIDKGVYMIFKNTISYLEDKNISTQGEIKSVTIDEMSLKALKYYEMIVG